MLYCPGYGCPLRDDCYRYTQPVPQRDRFAALPYDALTRSCSYFHSNEPSEAQIREAAYYIWLHAGRPEHCAQTHWEQAYRSLCLSTGRKLPDASG